jgi:ElaB/YqjD/DUF883 family membrane-anchored ribosome-binding protein
MGGSGSTGSSQSGVGASTGSGTGGDMKDMANKAQGAVDQKAQDLHSKIDQAADAAKPMVDKAVNSVQPVVDRLATTAHAGVDKLQGMLSGTGASLGQRKEQLTDAYGQYMDQGREYVRNNPEKAIAIAAGVGFLLAKLLGGRSRDY